MSTLAYFSTFEAPLKRSAMDSGEASDETGVEPAKTTATQTGPS